VSSFVLSKLDIDVLMQLAVYGPVGAELWEPMTNDPDRLGCAIWQQNLEAAEEPDEVPPVAGYRFAPLPIGITAEEGLKQCACYGYQTFDEGAAEPAGPFLERLERRLVRYVAGWKDAPWSWGPADVADRIERGGAPVVSEPDPDDPLIDDVDAALRRAGFAVKVAQVSIRDRITLRLVARWEMRIPQQPIPLLDVEVFADETAARASLRRRRQYAESGPGITVYALARTGRVVVRNMRMPDAPRVDVSTAFTVLGEPDEQWSRSDPPRARTSGTVLAAGVPTVPGLRPPLRHEWVAVGRDERSRRRIADLTTDDAVRAAILDVDLDRSSVLAVIGTSLLFDTIDDVTVRDRLYGTDAHDVLTELTITTARLPQPTATIIVTDAALPAGTDQYRLVERMTGHQRALHPDHGG
jgi:hypothetical protein